jgi:hypothetical protein
MFGQDRCEHAWDNVSKQELERGFGTDSGGNPPIGKRYRNQWFGSVPRCAIPGGRATDPQAALPPSLTNRVRETLV